MFNLLDVVFDSDYKVHEKIRYLETCNHLGTFGDEASKDTEIAGKKIKALLSIPKMRTDGLLLLHTLLPQCSSKVFVDNCESWTQYLLKIVKGIDRVANKRLALRILCNLIPYLKPFPQLWKKASQYLIPSLVESTLLLTPDDEWLRDSVELLSLCMLHFPGTCGPFKHGIGQFFVKHIDFWSGKLLENIATCVAYLPSCGGGGHHGVNHSTAWSEQINQIITCLNQLLDFLYDGVDISEDSPAIIFSSFELPPLQSADPVKAILSAWQRYELLSVCLMKMLSCQFPVVVKVPERTILSLACRVFSKNSVMMAKKASLECQATASVIPGLHCITLNILEGLMVSCHKRLIIHAGTINKLLVNVLKWTRVDEGYHGTSKPYSMLRVGVYQVVSFWLQLVGRSTMLERHAEILVPQLLSDITPEADSIQIRSRVAANFDKQKTKVKQKHLNIPTSSQDDYSYRKVNLVSHQDVCQKALKVLKNLLYVSGGVLAVDMLKQIHGVVINQLLYLRQGRNMSSSLYSNMDCQEELHAVLLACILRPHPLWPPPLQPAIQIFSMGQKDINVQVSSFCMKALAVCNTIIHPRVAILDYSYYSLSPAASPSVASEVESHVSILEPSHSRDESISQPAVARQSPCDKNHLEASHLRPQLAKRNPSQADVVMLSENESEHYSEEREEDTMDLNEEKEEDFTARQLKDQNVEDDLDIEGKAAASILQQTLLQQNSTSEVIVTPREAIPVGDKALTEHEHPVQKHFTNSYQEECEVSEDDAELIGTEEDEEGDYEDEEEEEEEEDVGDQDEEDEVEDEVIEEEEEYLPDKVVDSIPKHLQGYKPRIESADSNGIQVSSTTTKYLEVVPANATSEMDMANEDCEIVESEDNEDVDYSTSRPKSKSPELITCTLVDLSESPEKGNDLQVGGGPDLEAKVTENCQDNLDTSPQASCSKELVLQKNHTEESLETSVEDIPASTVEILDTRNIDEVHKIMETMISAVSLREDKPETKPVVTSENVVDVNGCDSTYYLPEGSNYDTPMRTEYPSVGETYCILEDGVESQVILETMEASSSTCDNTDEPLSKKQRHDEDNEDSIMSPNAVIASLVLRSPTRK